MTQRFMRSFLGADQLSIRMTLARRVIQQEQLDAASSRAVLNASLK